MESNILLNTFKIITVVAALGFGLLFAQFDSGDQIIVTDNDTGAAITVEIGEVAVLEKHDVQIGEAVSIERIPVEIGEAAVLER